MAQNLARKYHIRGWDVRDDGFDLNIFQNGVYFSIHLSPDRFVNSARRLKEFHAVFAKLVALKDEGEDVWGYCDDVAGLFVQEINRLAPPTSHKGKLTLADLRARGSFECEYKVINEQPIAGPVTKRGFDGPSLLRKEWNMEVVQKISPVVNPANVGVPYEEDYLTYGISPGRVCVGRDVFFHKAYLSPYDAVQEVEKYIRIHRSGRSFEHLRTSRLFGIVAREDGQVEELLYHWIELDAATV